MNRGHGIKKLVLCVVLLNVYAPLTGCAGLGGLGGGGCKKKGAQQAANPAGQTAPKPDVQQPAVDPNGAGLGQAGAGLGDVAQNAGQGGDGVQIVRDPAGNVTGIRGGDTIPGVDGLRNPPPLNVPAGGGGAPAGPLQQPELKRDVAGVPLDKVPKPGTDPVPAKPPVITTKPPATTTTKPPVTVTTKPPVNTTTKPPVNTTKPDVKRDPVPPFFKPPPYAQLPPRAPAPPPGVHPLTIGGKPLALEPSVKNNLGVPADQYDRMKGNPAAIVYGQLPQSAAPNGLDYCNTYSTGKWAGHADQYLIDRRNATIEMPTRVKDYSVGDVVVIYNSQGWPIHSAKVYGFDTAGQPVFAQRDGASPIHLVNYAYLSTYSGTKRLLRTASQ